MRLPNGKIYMDCTYYFHCLNNVFHGPSVTVLLDNATTPIPEKVSSSISEALKSWGNPSSRYDIGHEAKEIVDQSREKVARMVGATEHEILFTSGGTEVCYLIFNIYRACV